MSKRKGIPGMSVQFGRYKLQMYKNKNGGVTGVMYEGGVHVATLGSTKRRSQTVRAAEVWVSLAPTEGSIEYVTNTNRITYDQWRFIPSLKGKSWTLPSK